MKGLNKNCYIINNYHCNHSNQLSREVISLKTFHLIIQIYIYLEDKIFVCKPCFCSNLMLLIFKIIKLICNEVNDKERFKSKKDLKTLNMELILCTYSKYHKSILFSLYGF